MQTATATIPASERRVQQHFDRAASLYVDHGLEVYRRSVAQRLDMILAHSRIEVDDRISLLDIGCGGGAFVDLFLDRFPNATATGVDISTSMLAGNKPSERKTLVQGDALALPKQLGQFDVIAVDTVMHHLIDSTSYGRTQQRIGQFLSSLNGYLRPGGTVIVREIYHEFRVVPTLGSRAIFTATTLAVPRFFERILKAAGLQTANAGVCFQTRSQWPKLFDTCGFTVRAVEDRVWPGQPYKRFGFAQSGDLHYLLSRTRPLLTVKKGVLHG